MNLTQLVGTKHNICKVWGSNPSHHHKNNYQTREEKTIFMKFRRITLGTLGKKNSLEGCFNMELKKPALKLDLTTFSKIVDIVN